MSKSSAFLSHSFLKKDKKICDWFKKILDDFFVVDTAGRPEPDYIIKKVLPKIDKAEYFVALLCKRAQLLNEDNELYNSYISSPWIYSELGYAIAKNRKVLIFVEEGVHHRGMYPTDIEIISINVKKIEQNDKNVRDYVKKAIEEHSKIKESKSFIVDECKKEITAYTDGHAEIDVTLSIRILNDNFKKHCDAGFGLMDSKGKIIYFKKLSSLNEIKKRREINTICFNPLSKNLSDAEVALEKSVDKRTQFLIYPKKPLKSGDIIRYGIGVSAMDIFNDYKQGRREFTSHEVNDETDKLILILKIENTTQLKTNPRLIVYDTKGNIMKGFSISPKEIESTYFKIYSWELQNEQINIGYKYEITWNRI